MIEYLIFALSGALLMVGIILFIVARKKEKQKIEQIVERKKNEINNQIKEEKDVYDALVEVRHTLQKDCQEFEKTRRIEQERAQEAHEATERVLDAERERVNADLQGVKKLAEERMARELDIKEAALAVQYNYKKQQFEEDFNVMLEFYEEEISAAKDKLDEFQAKRAAVNEAIRREKELEDKESFYSIEVSQADQEDIQVLQSMDMRLHNRDVIPKLVWELFIRRPCQEMIKRVTGGRKIGGIYKITYKKTGEAYIGKTTDFATRWQNHCKTAIGLEGAARATLHNRLAKDGLWNYTFEILEEVDKDNLSSREAFYINLYGTKQQLNMKDGNK